MTEFLKRFALSKISFFLLLLALGGGAGYTVGVVIPHFSESGSARMRFLFSKPSPELFRIFSAVYSDNEFLRSSAYYDLGGSESAFLLKRFRDEKSPFVKSIIGYKLSEGELPHEEAKEVFSSLSDTGKIALLENISERDSKLFESLLKEAPSRVRRHFKHKFYDLNVRM